jgi:hypothetical protein
MEKVGGQSTDPDKERKLSVAVHHHRLTNLSFKSAG